MTGIARKKVQVFLAALLMVSSVFATSAVTPTIRLTEQLGPLDLEAVVPTTFGRWKLDPYQFGGVVNPQQQQMLDRIYSSTLTRSYIRDDGRRIMLAIAYGEDQRDAMQVHRPEVCYPAQGFAVTARHEARLDIGGKPLPVIRLESVLAERRYEPVTYWIVLAGEVSNSTLKKKVEEMKFGFRGVIPDGLIFRVSSIDRDSQAAFALQGEFLQDMLATMPPETRKRVSGI